MLDTKAGREKIHFIVFSDDWGVHPSSSQHLFRIICRTHNVSWINTVGMRGPKLNWSDLKKALQKLRFMVFDSRAKGRSEASDDVTVFRPLMFPFNRVRVIRMFNRWNVTRTLQKVAERFSDPPIIVTTVPNSCDYVRCISARRVVYYCVDDFSEWPGLDKSLVLAMESELIEKCDIFVATSDNLYNRLARFGRPTHLLPHGVDIEHFSSLPDYEHPLLAEIPRPRVGYFGLFDERSEQSLIAEIAESRRDVSFVIAGRVEANIDNLVKHQNVHFLGPIDYEELPSLITGIQVLFLPYKVDRLSESLSPLKMKEYIVTGRPVVSTPIPAAVDMGASIATASSSTEWLQLLNEWLDPTKSVHGNSNTGMVQIDSWQDQADKLLKVCLN